MADILIHMEMPEYTTKAEFGIDADGNPLCMVYHEDGTEPDIYDVVPLPKGHGRLIDADAVCKDIVLYRDVETCEAERGNNTQHLERAYGANETLCIVCDAPTIIPAEGGGGE